MTDGVPAARTSTVPATSQSEIAPGIPVVRSKLPADSVTGDRKVLVYPSPGLVDFNVHALEDIHLMGPAALMARDLMSPFVWLEPDGRFGIMVRAVTRPGEPMTDTGIIWGGWSDDGVHFNMLDQPSILPGATGEKDSGGVEDPTVVKMADGSYVVYYTGVEADMAHGEMFYATGPSLEKLVKSGVALASTKSLGNTKEATIDREKDGRWSLFYEYASDGASRIGLAIGANVDGPWDEQPTPFMPREDGWDNWHLSTGPMLLDDPEMPVMFYNGATHDARWRIGWVAFDRALSRVVDRCIEPLITPPPVPDRTASDIAFAASVTSRDGEIWLYYSLEDRRLSRARLRRS
ncbi:glycosidase [Sphingomonas sp. PAMC 26621]|uniref:glycosidase n=1 Tax=Sphingomonas sp. PAMC 26621 TaxID=1112213 RepID=UPI0002894B0A|nr:glycosidase [Sphingomonas sp. PAMC 26621]